MNSFHEQLFQALENYRLEHPDFIYILRTNRNKEKLDAGMWFLGDQHYAWISWITRSNNANHSPALRLLLKENKSGISCTIENGYKHELDSKIISFYEKVRELISKDYREFDQRDKSYFVLDLDKTNGIDSLLEFLETTKPKIDSIIESQGLQNILLTRESFNERLAEVNKIRNSPKRQSEMTQDIKRYWLFAPGKNAEMWENFYTNGIIAMNWDNLGDLSNYTSKEEISKKLQEFEQTTSSKKNDATANYEFKHLLKEGDIVIAKKGRDTYLGYGVVSSDYMFDDTKKKYKSYRNINWISKNEWTDEKGGIVVKTLTDITKYPEYVKRLTKLIGISESGLEKAQTTLSTLPLNSILYGPPGTGKTYTTVSKALQIVDPSFLKTHISDRKKLINRFQELAFDTLTEKGQIAFITFHQSMSYEDFIEGIKPIAPEGDAIQVTYEIVPGIFKQLVKAASSHGGNFNEKIEWLKGECSEAENKSPIIINTGNTEFSITYRGGKTFRVKPKKSINPDIDHPASIENIKKMYEGASRSEVYNPTYVNGILSYLFKNGLEKHSGGSDFGQKPFVLIIDEINRGNVSQIFGELITLIEQDKRKGASESIQIILPYSKEAFSVPKSLYIIGTMNTADRSVEALDTALRRRFTFEEMPPRYDLKELNRMAGNHLLKDILQRINIRLEKLLDKDHMIGHSYFMFPQDNDTISALMESFYKNIIPLLQEYFFGDYGKIGLVLGNGFVNIKDQKEKIFCAFDYDGADMLLEKPVYTIVDYRKPSSNLTDGMTFSLAIDTLMDNRI